VRPVGLNDVVFALALAELDEAHLLRLAPSEQLLLERLGDLAEQGGRGNDVVAAAEEGDNAAAGLKARHVAVEVEAVDTIDGQR